MRVAARLAVVMSGALALLIGGATAASAQERQRAFELGGPRGPGSGFGPAANPSEVVAAEIAFVQLARQKGQWTAFRQTADKDAVMFVPNSATGIVNAQAWLRKQANPAQTVVWSPSRIFMACDASYAVSMGAARYPDGRTGNFVTIWRRQPDGKYKWMLDWSARPVPATDAADDIIDGKIADCPTRRITPGADGAAPSPLNGMTQAEERDRKKRLRKQMKLPIVRIAIPPPADGTGQSPDGSLHWAWTSRPDGARSLDVTVRYEGKTIPLVADRFAGQP